MNSVTGMLAAIAVVAVAAGAQAQTAKPAAPAAMPKGDAAQGAKDFVVCKACHSPDKGVNKIGPSLFGVVGRTSGSVPGYNYSAANKQGHIVWTPQVLFAYLQNPRKYLPGTKMTYAGMADPQKRANIIAYLGTLK